MIRPSWRRKGMLGIAAWALTAVLAVGPVGAAEPGPADFAYGISLDADPGAPIGSVVLPQGVHETVVRPDLGDIRVFNRAGEPVPQAFRDPPTESTPMAPPTGVPFFPLYGRQPDAGSPSVRVMTDASGVIVTVTPFESPDPAAPVTGYLLDASRLPGPVDRLELFWSPDGKESVFQVNLDQGPDLDRFSPLIRNQTLADLAYGPHRLVRRDLVLGGHQARLYRLTWPHGTRGPVLSKVAAHFRLKANEPDRAWKSLTATPASDRPGAFEFDAGGFFPIDRIRIRPIQKNTLAQVALFSRTRPSDPWRPRGNHWVHRLEVDGIPLESDPVALDGGTDRYFRLEADPKSGGLGAGIPEIAIGWRPRMVYFVARGEGPFTLAYGHHSAQPAQTAVEPGLKAVQADPAAVLVRPARPGPIGPLGGPDRLKPPPEPFPWKKAMVWTVLVLGVALLGFLAWRLFRQLPKGEEPGDPSEPKGPL